MKLKFAILVCAILVSGPIFAQNVAYRWFETPGSPTTLKGEIVISEDAFASRSISMTDVQNVYFNSSSWGTPSFDWVINFNAEISADGSEFYSGGFVWHHYSLGDLGSFSFSAGPSGDIWSFFFYDGSKPFEYWNGTGSWQLVTDLTCDGFFSPMDNHPVKVKKNRVLPLKMKIYDPGATEIDDALMDSPPVVQVRFSPENSSGTWDVSHDALPAGMGTEGNEFIYVDGGWYFNLKTSNYTSAGLYTISVILSDMAYRLEPGCETSFVIE